MSCNIVLPKKYSQTMWEKYKNPQHEKYIGKNMLSWSQIETFNDKVGFNSGLEGKMEYILKYFCNRKFPDIGWGTFGNETESYITEKKEADKFSDQEKETLNRIVPWGIFQDEIIVYLEEIDTVVVGYIDDRTEEVDNVVWAIRDYKTKSESSKKDLHDPKKHQFEIYILGLRQRGLEVQNAEYCIIERLGGAECMRGGGRESLKIGEKIWHEPYTWDENRLKETRQLIISTAKEISDLYKIYLKIFG